MKFPYIRINDYFMPVIPVTVEHGSIRMATEALVDSGAASCIFDAQFADLLGIKNLESGSKKEFEGVSGDRLIGYVHDVTLEIGGNRFPHISIAFSRDMPDNAVNILGQDGFFEICPIKFSYRIKEIDIMNGGRAA
jgi:hypothetical protein